MERLPLTIIDSAFKSKAFAMLRFVVFVFYFKSVRYSKLLKIISSFWNSPVVSESKRHRSTLMRDLPPKECN